MVHEKLTCSVLACGFLLLTSYWIKKEVIKWLFKTPSTPVRDEGSHNDFLYLTPFMRAEPSAAPA